MRPPTRVVGGVGWALDPVGEDGCTLEAASQTDLPLIGTIDHAIRGMCVRPHLLGRASPCWQLRFQRRELDLLCERVGSLQVAVAANEYAADDEGGIDG